MSNDGKVVLLKERLLEEEQEWDRDAIKTTYAGVKAYERAG